MKPWELDAAAPPNPAGDIPPGGLGVDVPIQRGWQVSPADQAIRDEASRRLRANETKDQSQPKPWELDAAAPAKPTALPQAKAAPSTFTGALVDAFVNPIKGANAVAEAGLQMLTGAGAQAVGGGLALYNLARGRGLNKAVERIRNTEQALTYQPQTSMGKTAAEVAAYPFEQFNEGAGKVGEAIGGAGGRTIGENLLPVVGTVLPAKPMLNRARAARQASNERKFGVRDEETGSVTYYEPKDVQFARENAAKLQAHELARERGIITDPSATNPTFANKLKTGLANRDQLAHDLSIANEQRWGTALKEDIGLRPNAPLNDIETFRELRSNAALPAQEIARTGGQMNLTEGQIRELNGLRRDSTIANPGIEGQMDNLVNRAINTVIDGAPASTMLREIADLRKSARDIYKKTDAGTEAIANADTYMKIANTLEDAIESNLYWQAERNPYGNAAKLAEDYREGRRTMAKSYALEDATDMATGKVDPNKLARVAAKDNALTGAYADIGKISANFPEASRLNAPERGLMQTRLYRSGPPGVAGGIIGSALGPLGASAGGILGAGLGEIAGRIVGHRIGTPGAQAAGINPVPKSLWEFSGDPLAKRFEYGEPNVGREFNRAPEGQQPMLPAPPAPPGPSGPRGPIDNAPDIYRHPNFQFGENNPPQPRPPGTSVVPGRPLTPEEQWRQDKGNFAAQDRTRYQREAAMDAAAEREAEALLAALRQPASRERVLDLNPMTGKLESVSRGLPGATPETIRSTGSNLASAADKLSKGHSRATLTAEEKIAWEKTKTSLVEGVDELRGMSERQIFDRMQDRQWVADTIKKLREKDIAFEGIRRSAEENAARLEAAKQRELLADQLEVLQERFDAAPPRQEPKTQGPKTRAAKRKLSGNDATIAVEELRRR